MNSWTSGPALCSSESRTRVSGLALSRRLSNFCSTSRLCDRLWAWADGAMFRSLRRYPRWLEYLSRWQIDQPRGSRVGGGDAKASLAEIQLINLIDSVALGWGAEGANCDCRSTIFYGSFGAWSLATAPSSGFNVSTPHATPSGFRVPQCASSINQHLPTRLLPRAARFCRSRLGVVVVPAL
jgi:hypothetical protein